MSKRKVFGRRHFDCGGTKWKVEMRDDALYLRLHKTRRVWRIPFTMLLRYCHQQLELFHEQASDKPKQIENARPIESGNCKWANSKEQASNRRKKCKSGQE